MQGITNQRLIGEETVKYDQVVYYTDITFELVVIKNKIYFGDFLA